MTTTIQRLRVLEYEAAADRGEYSVPEQERVLADDEVARMLLGVPESTQWDRDNEVAVANETPDEGDGLAVMRGVMIGLVWVTPFWALIAAIILFT